MEVYLDHSATTPVHPDVLEVMRPYFSDVYGNPSSLHRHGKQARRAIDEAREKVARLIGAEPEEIIFTSGGTEADNLGVLGIAGCGSTNCRHLITSVIEHRAVLNACRHLETQGVRVTYLPVDQTGTVTPEAFIKALEKDTGLISIMHGNNEIGSIQPISTIGIIARQQGIPFHTDCVQSAGKIPLDVKELHCDLLSLSGHKIFGPKGVGALYIRKGVKTMPLSFGGEQEKGLRSGTENVPGIVGFGKACELAITRMNENATVEALRNRLQKSLEESVPDIHINGPFSDVDRLPHILSVSFSKLQTHALVRELDKECIAVSGGSACESGSREISHVITAIGIPAELAAGTIRFSLSADNTVEEIDYCSLVTAAVVNKMRMLSELEEVSSSGRCF